MEFLFFLYSRFFLIRILKRLRYNLKATTSLQFLLYDDYSDMQQIADRMKKFSSENKHSVIQFQIEIQIKKENLKTKFSGLRQVMNSFNKKKKYPILAFGSLFDGEKPSRSSFDICVVIFFSNFDSTFRERVLKTVVQAVVSRKHF